MPAAFLIESHYLPSLEYFYYIGQFDTIYIEAFENYQKQTYRNRCEILAANKVDNLTVPVIKTGQKVVMKEVKIDYGQKWVNIHWRAIESAYRNSPYFDYYAPYFEDIFRKKPEYLLDLNMELMTLCLQLMRWEKKIILTSDWKKESGDDFLDLRSEIHPKRDKNSLLVTWSPYRQLFGSNFVTNLSIVDLLFNAGPDSANVIRSGKKA